MENNDSENFENDACDMVQSNGNLSVHHFDGDGATNVSDARSNVSLKSASRSLSPSPKLGQSSFDCCGSCKFTFTKDQKRLLFYPCSHMSCQYRGFTISFKLN